MNPTNDILEEKLTKVRQSSLQKCQDVEIEMEKTYHKLKTTFKEFENTREILLDLLRRIRAEISFMTKDNVVEVSGNITMYSKVIHNHNLKLKTLVENMRTK